MEKDINLELLIEIVGIGGIRQLLKEAGEKAGEAKDWEQVSKISRFSEALGQETSREELHKHNTPN